MLSPQKSAPFVTWTAPFVEDGDFTPQDPLAVDYLNQQVGLWLFPGLTTRTQRPQYYAMVLYGLALVEEAIRHYGEPNDDRTRVALFERWERLWALGVLEHHGGRLARGHLDAMRGIRGVTRAWRGGEGPLPLDYSLIGRQNELGALGAYLSSLRHYRLVVRGDYRITPLAEEIVAAFWRDDVERISPLHQLALTALDRTKDRIPRKVGRASLAGLGRRARLTSLVEGQRTAQQGRLYDRLFAEAPDPTTHPLSLLVEAAAKDEVTDSETLLRHAMEPRWGELDDALRDLLAFAIAYGDAARLSLEAFNRVYDSVLRRGWVAPSAEVVEDAFDAELLTAWRDAASAFLDAPLVGRFRNLPVHAASLARLLGEVARGMTPPQLLEALLDHHTQVQTDRHTIRWLRREGDRLVADLTRYRGHRAEAAFPDFKLGVVRRLLIDCGRLPS
ncbi:MAG: hypothetical protein R3B72_37840 [Polyangiaceae bacterium]